jgi:hypothetical protein
VAKKSAEKTTWTNPFYATEKIAANDLVEKFKYELALLYKGHFVDFYYDILLLCSSKISMGLGSFRKAAIS